VEARREVVGGRRSGGCPVVLENLSRQVLVTTRRGERELLLDGGSSTLTDPAG
jgi:hypothetical protein